MTPDEKLFKGQLEDELVVSYYRRHWIALLPDVTTFAFFMTLGIFFFLNLQTFMTSGIDTFLFQELVVLVMGIMGFVIHRFFVQLIAHAMNIVVITNMRIIQVRKTLFRYNDQDSIYFRTVQDLQKQQEGFFKNICGFGELIISSVGSESVHLRTVPSPDRYFRILNRVRDETYQPGKPEQPAPSPERQHQELKRLRKEPAPRQEELDIQSAGETLHRDT